MPRGKLLLNILMQFSWGKIKTIGLFAVLEHAILKWDSFSWSRGWWLFQGTTLSPLPLNMCLVCRVCSLFGVTPLGTGSLGFKGHPSFQSNSLHVIMTLVWESRRRGSQRWQKKNKATKKRWNMKYFSVFYVHICTFNNSGIWLTVWSLHYFFFSINLKAWTLHYKIQWQDYFPVAW